jgi:type I restriction enzyme S subunit
MLDIEVFEGGFKETELGPLPEEWEVVRLGEVVEIYDNKRVPLSENVRKNMKGIYPYCGANGIIDYINDYIFDGEYVLVAEDGGRYGKFENTAYIMNGKFWVNNHAHILQARDGISINKFILYWFIYADISQYVAGTTRQKLTLSVLRSIPLPLPPLEEQKAIAGILSTVQSAIEKTEKVINALKNLKKSMMKHLFTYGPVAEEEAEKVELKETEIGLIPKHWEVVRVGEVFDVKQGKQLSSKESKEGKTLRPFLRTSNVLWNKIDISSISYMPFSDEEFEMLKLRRGDILVCEGGDVGRTSVWEGQLEECAYQNHLHRLRPKENNIVNYFFSYWMEYAICLRGLYVNSANRTTIPNLSAQRLKSFLIPLPPLEEQQKIAQILQSIDQRIEKEEKYKNALQNLFKSLLHNLMTGKIRVRVKSHGED